MREFNLMVLLSPSVGDTLKDMGRDSLGGPPKAAKTSAHIAPIIARFCAKSGCFAPTMSDVAKTWAISRGTCGESDGKGLRALGGPRRGGRADKLPRARKVARATKRLVSNVPSGWSRKTPTLDLWACTKAQPKAGPVVRRKCANERRDTAGGGGHFGGNWRARSP